MINYFRKSQKNQICTRITFKIYLNLFPETQPTSAYFLHNVQIYQDSIGEDPWSNRTGLISGTSNDSRAKSYNIYQRKRQQQHFQVAISE